MVRIVSFYADEHIPRAVVGGLRQRGADVLTLTEAGMLGASDLDHLERAQADGRVLVTHDADFLRLHAEGVNHAGIVFVPQPMPIGEMIHGLMLIHQVLDAEDIEGQVEFL